MAEKEKIDLGLDPEPESPMKKMIIIIVGTILVTLIIIFTTLYFLGIFPPKSETPPAEEQGTEETTEEEGGEHKESSKKSAHKGGEEGEAHAPTYESLDPFTITYKNNPEVRVVQVSISVMVSNPVILEAIKKHKPMIRNNLLLLLSAEDPVSLKTAEGKQALQVKIKTEIDAIIKKQIKEKNAIEGVFFTSFIMQ